MLERALTGKGRVAVFKSYQPGVKRLLIHRLTFYCDDFPSMALFVPIMAVANESVDSWSQNKRYTYRLSKFYHLLQSSAQDQTRGPPLPLAFLKSTTDDSNLTSTILSRITPLRSLFSFLVCFTATTQGHKPAPHTLR